MEEAFTPDLVPGAEVVFHSFPGIKLHQLQDKIPEMVNTTYTHMLVYIVITEAYRKRRVIAHEDYRQEHWGTVADFTFSNEEFAQRFSEFTRRCAEINDAMRVILIIPPFLD